MDLTVATITSVLNEICKRQEGWSENELRSYMCQLNMHARGDIWRNCYMRTTAGSSRWFYDGQCRYPACPDGISHGSVLCNPHYEEIRSRLIAVADSTYEDIWDTFRNYKPGPKGVYMLEDRAVIAHSIGEAITKFKTHGVISEKPHHLHSEQSAMYLFDQGADFYNTSVPTTGCAAHLQIDLPKLNAFYNGYIMDHAIEYYDIDEADLIGE